VGHVAHRVAIKKVKNGDYKDDDYDGDDDDEGHSFR